MTAQSTVPSTDNLLRRTLLANTLFSLTSGLALLLGAGVIATFLGIPETAAFFPLLAMMILGFAAFVGYALTRPIVDRRLAVVIFILDTAWVIASVFILITDAFSLSTQGRWAVLIVADIVGVLAVLEFIGLRRMA